MHSDKVLYSITALSDESNQKKVISKNKWWFFVDHFLFAFGHRLHMNKRFKPDSHLVVIVVIIGNRKQVQANSDRI